MKKGVSYNERAWAIDLISEINRVCSKFERSIRRAGGEWSVASQTGGGTLFPDVLLFGDPARNAILQGWELKMPDTAVTDEKLINNAQEKAHRLGQNSFLIWNVTDAVLYRIENGIRTVVKTWHCNGICTRADVHLKRALWTETLALIIDDLNDFFDRGELSSQKPLPAQLNDVITAIIEENGGVLAEHLAKEHTKSRAWRAEVALWWRGAKTEHVNVQDHARFLLLAKELMLHWIHRLLFAHYLKRFFQEAGLVDKINEHSTIEDVESIFTAVSSRRDFAQVFVNRPGAGLLPLSVWRVLLAFNNFLKSVRLPKIEQQLFQETLQFVRQENQRKVAGQYCTPTQLAELLVKLTVDNLSLPVFDPCCGTGTIARSVFDLKVKNGIAPLDAVKTTWASDKYAMPLQFATLALASGDAPYETLRIFRHDVLTLKTGKKIEFVDAKSGEPFIERLPSFPSVILNPPFVRFEDWMNKDAAVMAIYDVTHSMSGEKINAKADYFVPIILKLWHLVAEGGRVGAIFPNSWLGTDWGMGFRRILRKLFVIEAIITSGNGRWFQNADIVVNLVILKRRNPVGKIAAKGLITFGVTRHSLVDWTDEETSLIADSFALGKSASNESVTINHVAVVDLDYYDNMGFCWSAHFSMLNWIRQAEPSLVPVSSLFDVYRGERRGWDALFFPPDEAGIEPNYLRPVLKTAAAVKRLVARADRKAFCCSASVAALKSRGHFGALAWINKFQAGKNKKGRPLTESLAQSGQQWYEMRPDTTADLAVSVNPGQRLFFIRLKPQAFVNQRLIPLKAKSGSVDIELCHALLCSLIGCFYLEAIGFGRGLGVLDLNSRKLSRQMKMLDPAKVSKESREKIMSGFKVLQERDVLSFEDELESVERIEFEKAVFASFNLTDVFPLVKKAVLELHRIRNAACKQRKARKKE